MSGAKPTMSPAEVAEWEQDPTLGFVTFEPGEHGIVASYNRGCRCEACRAARSRYDRDRRAAAHAAAFMGKRPR